MSYMVTEPLMFQRWFTLRSGNTTLTDKPQRRPVQMDNVILRVTVKENQRQTVQEYATPNSNRSPVQQTAKMGT